MSRLQQMRWDALQEAAERDPMRAKSTRIGQFLLAAVVVLDGLTVRGIPTGDLAAIGLVVLGMTQMVRPGLRFPFGLVSLSGTLILWLALSNNLNGDPVDVRRIGHLTVWALVAYVFASGRLHLPSILRGFLAGAVVGVTLYLAGINVPYPGRLSGYIGDPNTAGMIIGTLAFIALGVMAKTTAQRLVIGIPIAAMLVLTLSRTSMTAFGVGLLWVALARFVRPIWMIVAVGGVMQYIATLPVDVAQSGVFADRAGSDSLRARLLPLEQIALSKRPWVGNGAGETLVNISSSQELFFHNSFLMMRSEGGWIAMALFTVLLAIPCWRAVHLKDRVRNPWLESAIIVPLICAVNLGEVLFALPMAIAIGALTHHYWTVSLEHGAAVQRPGLAGRRPDSRSQRAHA